MNALHFVVLLNTKQQKPSDSIWHMKWYCLMNIVYISVKQLIWLFCISLILNA